MTLISLRFSHFKNAKVIKKNIDSRIENLQKMHKSLITIIRKFDSFSFWKVSDRFGPRVMRDMVDTLGRARPVRTAALTFILYHYSLIPQSSPFFFVCSFSYASFPLKAHIRQIPAPLYVPCFPPGKNLPSSLILDPNNTNK